MPNRDVILFHPTIEAILSAWCDAIGDAYLGYRGHVYRMFNCCLALRDCTAPEVEKCAIAAAFHDLGLWSDQTVDYLPPSVARAEHWLVEHDRAEWITEVSLMIDEHHKLRPYRDAAYPLVEVFRKADLVDVSLGAIRFGIPIRLIIRIKSAIPNAGFHLFLLRTGKGWFLQHPLSPPPFMKW